MALVIEIREQELLFIHSRARMGGRLEILNNFSITIEGATINDEFDFDDEQLNTVIRDEFNKRGIVERYATIILNNRLGISKQLELPSMKRNQMINIARNELKMKLNLSSDYVVDVMRLETINKNDAPFERVMAVGVKYNDISKIEQWTLGFDIKIKSIQTGPSSILTLLSERNVITTENPSMFIDVGSTDMRFYIFSGKTFLKMRTIYLSKNFEETWERITTIIKMADSEMNREYDTGLSQIVLMGKLKQLEEIHEHLEKEIDVPSSYFDLTKILETENNDALGYLNGVGGLL